MLSFFSLNLLLFSKQVRSMSFMILIIISDCPNQIDDNYECKWVKPALELLEEKLKI